MKLTLQLKLLPNPNQHVAILDTMHAYNAGASHAAVVGYEAGVYDQRSIHRRCYGELRERYGLSSQMAVRAIGKAADALKHKQAYLVFKRTGAMVYDERLMSFKGIDTVSLLTLRGRIHVPMVYGRYLSGQMNRLKGLVDVAYEHRNFYVYTPIDLPDDAPVEMSRFVQINQGVAYVQR